MTAALGAGPGAGTGVVAASPVRVSDAVAAFGFATAAYQVLRLAAIAT